MASTEEIQLRITAKNEASKVIAGIDKEIDALQKQKAEIRVSADTKDADKKLDALDGEIDALKRKKVELQITADADQADRAAKEVLDMVQQLDKTTATAVLAINAAKVEAALSEVRTELANIDGQTVDIELRASQAATLQADLEAIETEIKTINATPVDIDTSRAAKNLGDVGKSAGSSKSVLANMVGNATQDLGALGGVAGSAGVAIGQMGEYMVDAKNDGDKLGQVLKNFGSVAVPIAAITVALSSIGSIFEAAGDRAERASEQVDAFTGSLSNIEDAKGAISGLLGQMQSFDADATSLWGGFTEGVSQAVANVPLLGGVIGDADLNISNVIPTFNRLNITAEDIAAAAVKGGSAWDDLQVTLWAANEAGQISNDQYAAASQLLYQFRGSAERAAVTNEFLGKTTDENTGKIDENTRAYIDQAAGMNAMTAKQEEATAAAKEYSDTISSAEFGRSDFEGAITGMSKFHDQFFALTNIAADTEAAFDALGKSLEDNGKTFDVNTEAGRNNMQAVEDLASVVDTQLIAAYDDAGGSFAEFDSKAKNVANTLRDRLIHEMGLSETEADDLIAKLGLMPTDIETRYKLSGDEEAKIQLQLLQGSIDRLPKNVQAVIDYKILMGDYVGAVQTAQNYANRHPVTIPVELRVSTANLSAAQMSAINAGRGAANGTNSMPPGGGIAGEAGGEFVRLPNGQWGYVDRPTWLPPKTKVISVRRTRSILHGRGRGPTGRGGDGGLPSFAGGTGGVLTVPIAPTVVHNHTHVNAAVIGNRFDVARAVSQAQRDLVRIRGTRP